MSKMAKRVAAKHLKEAAYPKEFLDSVRGQSFRNPNPQGRKDTLVFTSLPSQEQQRVYDQWRQRSAPQREEVPLRSLEEKGVSFETGKPVEFTFLRNTEKAPKPSGADPYQQKIEPAGFYVTHHTSDAPPQEGWITGSAKLENPLVLALNPDPDARAYDDNSWKKQLERRYKKRGNALSKALKADGYDGIVTVAEVRGKPYTSEIVVLDSDKSVKKASEMPFSVGDEILYGKWKNKRGKVIRFFDDDRGVPSVEIEPVPKGRKQNKVLGLYKIWKTKEQRQKQACVIFSKKCDNEIVLGKVRDRMYDPEVCVYHLEVQGVEMCIMFDRTTGFCEGVNEFGIGIVNSSLMVLQDEREGMADGDSDPERSPDGIKIVKALTQKTIAGVLRTLITHKPKKFQRGLKGHTLVSDGTQVYALENTRIHTPKILKLTPDEVHTRTNHGIYYPGAGYTKGEDYVSSIVRQWEAKKQLEKVNRPEDLMPALTQGIEKSPSGMSPVRFTDKMRTTSQMLVNPAKKEILLYMVPEHSKFEGIRNLLPDGRKPKVNVRVFEYPSKTSLKTPYVTVPDEMESASANKSLQRQVMAERVAARYKSKKKVKKQDGGDMTVYEYSDRQISDRNRKKAERLEKLRKSMKKLQTKVRKDVTSKNEKVRDVALAVGLMDETFERVGNPGSAKEGHFGVTTWCVKHLRFGKSGVTITYVGKSGVDQKKKVSNPRLVSALKKAVKDKGKDACVLDVSSSDVNAYLKPFDITAKDIRGFHANTEMKEQLRKVRKGKLPADPKDKEKKLKDEFNKALEAAAERVGHEASTLKSQYLVPGLEDDFMRDGTVNESHTKKGAVSLRTAAENGTPTERRILANAMNAPVLVVRDRKWWLREAPSIYRMAREHEKVRPTVEGLRFDPQVFSVLWYEDADGNNLGEPKYSNHAPPVEPEGAKYQRSQFPNYLRDSMLRLNDDGTSTAVMEGNRGYQEDLVTAMVRTSDWDVGDAIMVAAQSCERCLNVLCHCYLGSDEGYKFGSGPYWESGTSCKMCEHHTKTASPTYESYLQRKRTEGGRPLSREHWEARVHGVSQEPTREDWESHRQELAKKHGLSKFQVSYRPEDQHLSLGLIAVDDSNRGQGSASRAMQDMLAWADSNGSTVTLSPTSEFGASKKRLEKWYRSMGFVPNKGRNKDYRFTDAMLREPQAKTATKTPSEKEDEQVQKMLRNEPKKKPPRRDLRNNRTLEVEDEDLEGMSSGDKGDRDLSLKWNKVGRRVSFRWLATPQKPSATKLAFQFLAEIQAPSSGTQQQTPSFDDWVKEKRWPSKAENAQPGAEVGFEGLKKQNPPAADKVREEYKRKFPSADDEGGKREKGKEDEPGKRTREDIDAELESARHDVEELEDSVEGLQEAIKKHKKNIQTLRQKAKKPRVAPEARKEKIESRIDEEKQKMRDTVSQMKPLGKELDALDDKTEGLKKDIKGHTSVIKDSKAFVDQIGSDHPQAKQLHDAIADARSKIREAEGELDDIKEEVKTKKTQYKELRQSGKENAQTVQFLESKLEEPDAPDAHDPAQQLKDERKLLDDAEEDLEEKKGDLKAGEAHVKELKAERKDPTGGKRQEADSKKNERAKRVREAIEKTTQAMESMMGKGSTLSRDVKEIVETQLNDLDDDQMEEFALEFSNTLQELTDKDPTSDEAVSVANRIAKSGFSTQGLSSPGDLAERLAQIAYTRNVVANPLITGGIPVGQTEMDAQATSKRAIEGFRQFKRLNGILRREAAQRITSQMRGLDPETDQARELKAILTGMNMVHIADSGEALPGQLQPSKGSAALIRKMVETGNAEEMLRPSEELFSDESRQAMRNALNNLDDDELADFMVGDDESHPFYKLKRILKHEGAGASEYKQLVKSFMIDDWMNDIWGDRATRDVMEGAGAENWDDPEARAEILAEAKGGGKNRQQAFDAMIRIDEARAKGERPSDEDQALVNQMLGEGGGGLMEGSRSLLKTLKDKFDKWVISPATAVLRNFVETGDKTVMDTETLPHPDEGSPEPRTQEQREKARDKTEAPEQSETSKGDSEKGLTREKWDAMSQAEKDKVFDRLGMKEKGLTHEKWDAMSQTEKDKIFDELGMGSGDAIPMPGAKSEAPAPKKDSKKTKVRRDRLDRAKKMRKKIEAQLEKLNPDQRAKFDERIKKLDSVIGKAEEGIQDEKHGPGDVWETAAGNWRAMNSEGSPKTFKDKNKAEAYAKPKTAPETSRDDRGDDEEFSADFNVPVEDKGPDKFASDKVADLWLARVRSFHPDDPNRPFIIVKAA